LEAGKSKKPGTDKNEEASIIDSRGRKKNALGPKEKPKP